MKSKILMGLLLAAGISFVSCNNATEQTENNQQKLSANITSADVQWTAFKTTAKAPVKGHFTDFKVSNTNEGATIEEVMNNAEVSINAFEIATNDTGRDATIKQNFFEKMTEPGKITGKLKYDNGIWSVQLRMNGITVETLPATVSYANDTVKLNTTIDLNEFQALNALEALNTACFELHKGADGISKTWDVVEVEATMEVK